MVEVLVFIVAAAMVLFGAVGVVVRKHPVHCALSMVLTLFGIAVLFLAMDAQFLAAVQIIVYAGAIVVLLLFVIMLMGVDKAESLAIEPLKGQRPVAIILGIGTLVVVLAALFVHGGKLRGVQITGALAAGGAAQGGEQNVKALALSLFSDYVFAFEATSVLLVIAVLGTVMLARRPPKQIDVEAVS
jgi:NADH-quinone oxidoreductase subunit J